MTKKGDDVGACKARKKTCPAFIKCDETRLTVLALTLGNPVNMVLKMQAYAMVLALHGTAILVCLLPMVSPYSLSVCLNDGMAPVILAKRWSAVLKSSSQSALT